MILCITIFRPEFFKYKRYEKYRGYRAIVRYDERDNIYWGEVLDINNSIAFHGDTPEQCIEYFHKAIDNYIFNKSYHKMLIDNSFDTGVNINDFF